MLTDREKIMLDAYRIDPSFAGMQSRIGNYVVMEYLQDMGMIKCAEIQFPNLTLDESIAAVKKDILGIKTEHQKEVTTQPCGGCGGGTVK